MKKIFTLLTIVSAVCFAGWLHAKKKAKTPRYERLRTGDIVFQHTGGEQGVAVEAATNSPYTHVGVVFEKEGELYVLEAVQPVQVIRLKDFRKRSDIFHARRLIDETPLDMDAITKAIEWGQKQIGKDYDSLFQWSDDTLYCSELVWKVYHEGAGLDLCKTKNFSAYFIEKPEVRAIIKKRYGNTPLPATEPVVAPSDLAESPLLKEVPHL